MSSTVNPEYRLRNVRRQLRDLLWGRRLSGDPEQTGIVDLSDFGKRCDAVADFAAESVAELDSARGGESACARRVLEEVELAARAAALLETLPPSPQRLDHQCGVLEESAAGVDAALNAECLLEEPPAVVSLSVLAKRERELFQPLFDFEGRIENAPPGLVDRGHVRRALRRALVSHEGGPFALAVTREGELRFADFTFQAEGGGDELPRSADEPPEVKKALDMREAAPDEALKDFLLVKAVDEALCAVLSPRLAGHELPERARALPTLPGKRLAVRPEAVRRDVALWDEKEAAKAAAKLAARRIGPEWARLPKGAYVLRLFLSEDDALAGDLLALGPALRRMEKGEEVPGTGPRAERALLSLLGLLG